MATIADAITYARQICQTDSNGITDTMGLAFANDGQQDFIRALIDANVDAAQTAEAYKTLLPTDSPPGCFLWPSDMYKLKTIEVNYNGSAQADFIQAMPMDVANIQDKSFDWLRLNQSVRQPVFDNRGDTAEVFPTPTASSTVRIFYYKQPTEFSATSSTISYPLSLDYRCLSCKIANIYQVSLENSGLAMSRGKVFATGQAALFDRMYQERLDKIIAILTPASQQPITPQPLIISGWQF